MKIHNGKKAVALLLILTMIFAMVPDVIRASDMTAADIAAVDSEQEQDVSPAADLTDDEETAATESDPESAAPEADSESEVPEAGPEATETLDIAGTGLVSKETGSSNGNTRISSYALDWNSVVENATGNVLTGDDLDMTPAANTTQSVTIQISFSLGGDQAAEPGEVEIRIPLSIFSDRDGNPVDSINIPLVQAPETGGLTSFHYYIDGDEVVITNFAAINGASYFLCNVEYTYLPSDIEDGYVNSDITADYTIAMEGYEEEKYTSDPLSVTVNTDAKIQSLTKKYQNKYETWQSQWGTEPADADDYIYVMWQVNYTAPANCTQPYTVDFTEIIGNQGILVGTGSLATGADLTSAMIPTIEIEVPGTVATLYTRYVLVKYPRTMLDDEETTTITNEVTADLTGEDNAEDSKTANADYVYVPVNLNYPGDGYSLGKIPYGTNAGSINSIEDDQETKIGAGYDYSFAITTTARAWDGTDDGTEDVTVALVDDMFFIGSEQLQPEDYTITSCFAIYMEYDYQVDANSGYTAVLQTDYSTYEPVEVYYQTSSGSGWQLAGVLTRRNQDGAHIYTDTAGNSSVCSSANQIPLPSDAYAVKFEHTSSRYQVYMAAYLSVTLNPTDHVKSLLADKQSVLLYNVDSLCVTDSAGNILNGTDLSGITTTIRDQVSDHSADEYGQVVQHAQAQATLTRLAAQTKIAKTAGSITSDVVNGQETLTYRTNAFEEVSYAADIISADEVMAMGLVKEQTQGVFYDLLPAGTAADTSTIAVATYGNNTACTYTVELVQNWQNSGQTMMIVYVTAPSGSDNYYKYTSGSLSYLISGFTLSYKLIYTWENIHDYGSTALNSVAYRSDTGTLSSGITAAESGITKNEYYQDLDNDGIADDTDQNTVYAQNSTVFNPLEATELGYSKAVRAIDETVYSKTSEAQAMGRYTYRLRFANSRDVASTDLVMYDVLEEYDSGSGLQWKGTLASVITVYAENKGIAAVVYYSTRSGLVPDQPGTGDADLTDSSIWSTTAPADLSEVTAIAIDLSKQPDGSAYILEPEEVVLCYVEMQAPGNVQDYLDPIVYAYNSSYAQITYQTTNADPVTSIAECNYTQVSLRTPDVAIVKSSDPESGTAEQPASVDNGDTINYTISVTNTNSAAALNDVEITDVIPDALIIDLDEIKYYFGSDPDTAEYVADSTRVSVTADGQKLVFEVDRLLAEETVNFIIPTTVSSDAEAQVVIENTAAVTKIDGSEGVIESNTTYHIITKAILNLEATKELIGASLEDDQFAFVVTDEDGFTVATAANKADGTVEFSELVFEETGTYVYTMKEASGTDGDVVYDGIEYTITVTVTENEDGTLTATPVYPEDGIVFTNHYINRTAAIPLSATKKLTGKTLTKQMFSFNVSDEDGNVVATATNNADGTIDLGTLSFTAAGTYVYTVTEVNDGASGIIYDDSEYQVTVEVTADEYGSLSGTAVYPDGGVVFNNSYTNENVTVSLTGTKTLSGKTLTSQMFSFNVSDEDGNVVATAKNNANGTINLAELNFTAAGTYTYTVTEVNDGASGITYDKSAYQVTVEVTENADGSLSGTAIYPDGGIVFNNVYSAVAGSSIKSSSSTSRPVTGDNSKLMLFLMLAGVSFGILVYVGIRKRRVNK